MGIGSARKKNGLLVCVCAGVTRSTLANISAVVAFSPQKKPFNPSKGPMKFNQYCNI
jgi:hypothetical protein